MNILTLLICGVVRSVVSLETTYVSYMDSFTMRCYSQSGKDYRWLKNNAVIDKNYETDIEFKEDLGVETMTIRSFQKKDNGVYKCYDYQYPIDPIIERKAVLLEEVKLKNFSPTVRIREGETAKLWCNATSVPPPAIKWYIKEGDLTVDAGISGKMFGIRDITRHCPRKYVCEAENLMNRRGSKIMQEIKVETLFKPEVHIEISIRLPGLEYSKIDVIDGKVRIKEDTPFTIKLVCSIESNPFTSSVWYANNSKLVSYNSQLVRDINTHHILRSRTNFREKMDSDWRRSVELIVGFETGEEFGQYTCNSQNSEGSSNATVILSE